jgi:hypothetical protein
MVIAVRLISFLYFPFAHLHITLVRLISVARTFRSEIHFPPFS